jgi:alkylhydroperoxidase family enzyme
VSGAGPEADTLKGAFNEEQFVDIVVTVALANMTNRITEPLGLELEMAPEKI